MGGLYPRLRKRPWHMGLAVAVLCLLAGAWLLLGPPDEPPSPLPYEEPILTQHNGLYSRVDHALFDALEKASVQPESLRVLRRVDESGEMAQVLASTLPGRDPGAALTLLAKAVADAGADCTIQQTPEGDELLISLEGRTTHQVLLRPGGASSASPSPRTARPLVALVVDDMGYRLKPAKRLASLGIPMTWSILPHAPHGPEIAALARRNGIEVMLHLPMEPAGFPKVKPGPGALLVGMSRGQLKRLTVENLATVPYAKGVNNHMGSVFCTKRALLEPVFKELKIRGMFFLDSRTSPRTKALATARLMGLPSARRDVFVDHDHSPRAIDGQLRRLMALAKRQGRAIAILHPNTSSIEALERWAPQLKKKLLLVTASRLTEPPLKSASTSANKP